MRHTNQAVVMRGLRPQVRARGTASTVALMLIALLSVPGVAQQPAPKTFASPEAASDALFAAVQSNNLAALLDLFGPSAQDLVVSGDSAQDARERRQFVYKYREMHRLAKDSTGATILYVGAENWPLPIPLVEADGAWHFDTDAAKSEILYRRIGRNELAAIRVCHALVDAEHEYYASAHDGATVRQYAGRFVSNAGKEDGLYWSAAADQPSSPIGPLLAAAAEGEAPFHGYYYRLLTRQGASAPGGAKAYVVDGELTAGFAFVAYPAEYRSSGVMTFIVNQGDVVYEKDLGANTQTLASALTEYNPDATWRPAEP
jgi:hypothetical protein